MDRGDLDARNMPSSVPALIGADGTFSLALSQAHDWLLVLIDSTAAPEYRFVDSLAINAGTDTMLSLRRRCPRLNRSTSARSISQAAMPSPARP